MMRILPKMIVIFTAMSTLFSNQMHAYCARCVKIEEERAKEQAAHPQPWRYYEDQVSLNTYEEPSLKNKETTSTEDLSIKPSQAQLLSSSQTSNVLLVLNERPINEDYFEEKNIQNPGSQIDSKPKQKESETSRDFDQSHPFFVSSRAYSTIYTIFKTKNFLETLAGSFTLFIPTNEALQQFSPRTLVELTRPENEEKLAALVSNHIIARKILKKDFIENNHLSIKAISGKNLTLSYTNGKLYIDDVQILRIEPAGYDGIIYLIDKVLTP